MHISGLPQQYERTCEDCGQTWRVSRAIAHPHMQGLPMGRSGGGRGPGATGAADRAEAIAEANAALAERAAASRRCPKCESDHYKQRAIRS
jgi:hypothetical protein